MERIKADVAKLFNEASRALAMNDGYKVGCEAGEDVLLLRPAIIDLDITAPAPVPTPRAARGRTLHEHPALLRAAVGSSAARPHVRFAQSAPGWAVDA